MSNEYYSPPTLHDLANRVGIAVDWNDAHGQPQTVKSEVICRVLKAMDFACESDSQIAESIARLNEDEARFSEQSLVITDVNQAIRIPLPGDQTTYPFKLELEDGKIIDGQATRDSATHVQLPGIPTMGYHRLQIADRSFRIALAPPQCYTIANAAAQAKPRLWGLAAQLYSLRRNDGDGIGDFTALAEIAKRAAQLGASAIGISPVHAMFGADPSLFSPYSPSSRLFLNPVYADPSATFGKELVATIASLSRIKDSLTALERRELIDWPGVTKTRLALMRQIFTRLDTVASPNLRGELQAFREQGGTLLEDHARFEVLHASISHRTDVDAKSESPMSWRQWPAALRDPRSAEVAAFAEQHAEEVSFQIFLQWMAARGLQNAQKVARDAGMPIGLIADLAVGTAPEGSHAWSRQREMLIGVTCGAPPDVMNQLGQSWGLSVFSPYALRMNGFEPFLELLRTTMSHGGGIRIDHVLGLRRMWLVPDGASPVDGAYLKYPMEDMLRLIALESWRHHSIVIGENLGTVPEGFNDLLKRTGVMGTSVLWFEREGDRFTVPNKWAGENVATTTTHDLPSVTGWWRGRDIDWRKRLELFGPNTTVNVETIRREKEKKAFWTALCEADVAVGKLPEDATPPVDEAISFVGKTAAPLVLIPLEDICALVEQPNLPGTVSGHPNWQQRLPTTVETLFDDPKFTHRLKRLAQARNTVQEE